MLAPTKIFAESCRLSRFRCVRGGPWHVGEWKLTGAGRPRRVRRVARVRRPCDAPCWMCATVWPEPKTAEEMVAFYEQRWLRLVRVGEGIYLFGSGNLW